MINVNLNIKAKPVSSLYQPIYKLVMILAILKYGCSKPHRATHLKLNLYLWSLREFRNYQLLNLISKKKKSEMVPWSFEPGLEDVLTIAVINDYCIRNLSSSGLQIEITSKGLSVLNEIEKGNLFTEGISQIKEVGVIPQTSIIELHKNWTIN